MHEQQMGYAVLTWFLMSALAVAQDVDGLPDALIRLGERFCDSSERPTTRAAIGTELALRVGAFDKPFPDAGLRMIGDVVQEPYPLNRYAASILAQSGDGGRRELLRASAEDSSVSGRRWALIGLGQHASTEEAGNDVVLRVLLEAVDDPSLVEHAGIAALLCGPDDPRFVDWAVRHLESDHEPARLVAILLAGRSRVIRKDAILGLGAILREKESVATSFVFHAIGQLGSHAGVLLPEIVHWFGSSYDITAFETAHRINPDNPRVERWIREHIDHEDPQLRNIAAGRLLLSGGRVADDLRASVMALMQSSDATSHMIGMGLSERLASDDEVFERLWTAVEEEETTAIRMEAVLSLCGRETLPRSSISALYRTVKKQAKLSEDVSWERGAAERLRDAFAVTLGCFNPRARAVEPYIVHALDGIYPMYGRRKSHHLKPDEEPTTVAGLAGEFAPIIIEKSEVQEWHDQRRELLAVRALDSLDKLTEVGEEVLRAAAESGKPEDVRLAAQAVLDRRGIRR